MDAESEIMFAERDIASGISKLQDRAITHGDLVRKSEREIRASIQSLEAILAFVAEKKAA